ncbi:hypothetical protein [Jeotgalibacillus aurantiacus]|uniref:hypothetical protein n=1 Tax=Jeotgalibacillus aurantiacus TaxID=2763266 RepID=UPI001D0B6728|nr:hypothetical protein [Jeotgalibacillus aurantiacus]
MKINVDLLVNKQGQTAKDTTLKQGDLFTANIKSTSQKGEAVLQAKGQDFSVKVDGVISDKGRGSFEVTGFKDGQPVVKQIHEAPQKSSGNGPDHLSAQFNNGKPVSGDLKSALALISEKGIPIDKKTFADLKNFMSKADGSVAQKLGTLEALIAKNLPITADRLNAVHAALRESALQSGVADLLKQAGITLSVNPTGSGSVSPNITANQLKDAARQRLIQALTQLMNPENSASVKQLIQQVQSSGDLKQDAQMIQNTFRDALLNSPEAQKFLNDAIKLLVMIKPSDSSASSAGEKLLEAIQSVKKIPDISTVINSIKSLSEMPEWKTAEKEMLQTAFGKADQAALKGLELQARQELMQVLQGLAAVHPIASFNAESYSLSEDLINSIPFQSRDVIVTRISEKMSQAAIDFKNIQKDITRNLSYIQLNANQSKQQVLQQAKPMLEATIKMLDNAILKGDFMLYTNMETEKKLMKASGQLAEASKLLAKGEIAAASRITSEIKAMMEKIEFKPSDVKVQHFVSKEIMQLNPPSLQQQTALNLQHSLQQLYSEPSARSAYEHVRNMGMTFENEQAHSLLTRGQGQEQLAHSLKAMLMKMAQGEGGKMDAMNNQLTGQQLLSKTDSTGLQSMVMTLPFILQEKVESFKVYMQSKNGSQKIDWENCSLYFLFDTKKMGEIGVSLNVSDRNLNVKMKNDQPDFEKKMQPITELAKERLGEIGYHVQQLQFGKLTPEVLPDSIESAAQKSVPFMTEKGYDFSV